MANPSSSSQSSSRRNELDWLRVLAFGILILFHTGMMFNTWDWHVKNNVTVGWIEFVMAFFNQWRMPLLFFVSGAAVWFMLDKYPAGRFVLERHKRLLLPLVVGMLVVIPPQVYFERLFQGASVSFAEFYTTVFHFVPYPEGNFSWHHLWYIPYIFVYSLLLLPVFLLLKRRPAMAQSAQRVLSNGWRVYVPFVFIAISEVSLRPFWRGNENNLIADWAQFTSMAVVFTCGFLLANAIPFWDRLAQWRKRSALLACGTFALVVVFWELDIEDPPFWMMTIFRPIRSLNMWLWIATALGMARHHLTFRNSFLTWANEAVYPYYIFHQTITVIAGFYLAPLDWPVAVKFLVLAAETLLGCFLLYEIVRRVQWLRPLFGLRMKPWTKANSDTIPMRTSSLFGSE